ncbi:MAG: F0F1 ATP synthase subunit B [Flavobacteriales bacterium]
MEKLISEFSVGLFFWQAVLFIALIFLLRKFAWKPILNAVNEREEKISSALEMAEKTKVEMAQLKSQNEDLMKKAREERDEILREAREAKAKMIEEAKGLAQKEADKMVAQAREAIKNEKLAAISELKNQVATLSIEVAEKIIKAELSKDGKQKELAHNLVEEINLN